MRQDLRRRSQRNWLKWSRFGLLTDYLPLLWNSAKISQDLLGRYSVRVLLFRMSECSGMPVLRGHVVERAAQVCQLLHENLTA
jgi:hypothetical protein